MAGEKSSVEEIRFNFEDLLSQENIMNPDSVASLQDMLNKYIYGVDRLEVDGKLGPNTLKAIKQFRNESRYWGGSMKIGVNPLETYELYLQNKEKERVPVEETVPEDLREGGGDMGPY